jgi:drug/metabolite transporter (DMT)-like permease
MKNLWAHLAVLAANLIYGANYSIAKTVMPEYLMPLGFVMVRVAVTAALFCLCALFIREKEKLSRSHYVQLALCGLFGVAANQLLFFAGLNLTQPVNAALMMTTNPVLVLLMAHFMIHEKISILRASGILLALSGAAFLILYGKKVLLTAGSATGDLMVFLNSLSFAIFLVLVKPLMLRFHVLTVMKWTFLFGLIPVTFFGFQEVQQGRWMEMNTMVWLSVGYVVIATTFLAYLLNITALQQLDASQVSVYIYLQPVFASAFSVLFGKGYPQWIHLIAAMLIFSGIALTAKKSSGR